MVPLLWQQGSQQSPIDQSNKKIYRRKPLSSLAFSSFNKQYFKKYLAAKIPLLSLHPANEKTRLVLKKKNKKTGKFSKENLPIKPGTVSLPSALKKRAGSGKKKCKKRRNFRKKIW